MYNAETVAFVSLDIVHQVYSPPAKCTSALAAMTVTEVELKGFEEHSLSILEISEWKRAMMRVTLGLLSLPFAERMAPQAKAGEMLSTEEW
jgi:hypothetical protein